MKMRRGRGARTGPSNSGFFPFALTFSGSTSFSFLTRTLGITTSGNALGAVRFAGETGTLSAVAEASPSESGISSTARAGVATSELVAPAPLEVRLIAGARVVRERRNELRADELSGVASSAAAANAASAAIRAFSPISAASRAFSTAIHDSWRIVHQLSHSCAIIAIVVSNSGAFVPCSLRKLRKSP
jgi:hypothetical protein